MIAGVTPFSGAKKTGNHYLIKEYLKPGVFVGGAGLVVVTESEGDAAIAKLDLAKGATCSK